MIKQKVLPLEVPALSSYQSYAALYGIARTDEEKLWVVKHCLSLFLHENPNADPLNRLWISFYSYLFTSHGKIYELCPFVDCSVQDPEEFGSFEDYKQFAVQKLLNGNYLFLRINYHDISGLEVDEVDHDIFIHGVDLNENVFYCADHVVNFGRFTKDIKMDIDEVLRSSLTLKPNSVLRGTIALKLRNRHYPSSHGADPYRITTQYLKQQAKEFMGEKNHTYMLEDADLTYGIDVYYAVYNSFRENEYDWGVDIRPLQILLCHIAAWIYMLRQYDVPDTCMDGLEQCNRKLTTIRNYLIRHNMAISKRKPSDFKEKAVASFREVIDVTAIAFNNIIEYL